MVLISIDLLLDAKHGETFWGEGFCVNAEMCIKKKGRGGQIQILRESENDQKNVGLTILCLESEFVGFKKNLPNPSNSLAVYPQTHRPKRQMAFWPFSVRTL